MPVANVMRIKQLFGEFVHKVFNSSGDPVKILAETDGTVRVQLLAWDGAQERVVNETSGRLAIVNYGKDSGGTEDPLRTNANQQLQVEVINDTSVWVQVDPQLIAAAEADLWDPGGDAGDIYDLEFLVVNVDGTNAVDVSIGQDVAGGGGLTAAEYFMFTETIPAKGSSGWRGPFRIGGDDHIRGVATAANDACIHIRAKLIKDV